MKSLNNIELKPGQRVVYAVATRGVLCLGTVVHVLDTCVYVQGDGNTKPGKLMFGNRIAVIGNPTEGEV